MIESGEYKQPALHEPTQSEHTCWPVTAQKVPNIGSVNPPELGHVQSVLLLALSCVGAVLHIVAASFQALHAAWAPSNVQHVIFEGLADAVITCCGAGGGRWKRV